MAGLFATCGGGGTPGAVHRCAGAGRWFPEDPQALRASVTKYLRDAEVEKRPGEVVALVSPHAGYPYSGPVSGHSYATVQGRSFDRVVILAFSHRYPMTGLSVVDYKAYETPLGSIPVDRECVQALLQKDIVRSVPQAHTGEWSDENQLPFLQVALEPGWKLVSVFVGEMSEPQMDAAVEALRPVVSGNTLIVVSSDFTHLENATPAEQDRLDLGAAKRLVAKDMQGFVDLLDSDPGRQGTICGRRPLALLLGLLGDECAGHLLEHQTSGARTGQWDYSVGYCAIVFTAPARKSGSGKSEAPAVQPEKKDNPGHAGLQSDEVLTPDEEQTLLQIARLALVEWIENRSKDLDLSAFDLTANLRQKAGAFVTLKRKGQLRGCIGYIEPIKPLYETVIENARNAATNDPRFPAVTPTELPRIDLEISVMTPLREVQSVDEIVVGKHGLTIEKGFNRGVFLPQVPVDQGWNLPQYLEGICAKAHLPPGSWKEGATLKVFTAQVFGEKERTHE